MKQQWWSAKGVGPSQDADRFLLLLALSASMLGALSMVLYLALR